MDSLVEVEVEFPYTAEQPDELTIKVGDVIKNVVMEDRGWWEGELNGKKGMFPDIFVKSFFSRDRDSFHFPRSGPPTQKLNISSQASLSRNRQVTFASSDTSVQDKTERAPARRQDTVILDPQGGNASVTLDEEETVIIPDPEDGLHSTSVLFHIAQVYLRRSAIKGLHHNNQLLGRPSQTLLMPLLMPLLLLTAFPWLHQKNEHEFTFSSPIVETVPVNKPESPEKRAFGVWTLFCF
ncbi:hypothetical protein DPMN_075003 [Dreissena polymorpha]|uniref:SH3 domain-containing protein n=1 Tax=Dreissena polymorpha TaxID=45954 RepID=A0A9D4BNZ3_DREPO|nr:hypothetical protein DPMN_075003 [Dreissena polymorpha]